MQHDGPVARTDPVGVRLARNRHRQRELYGAPLGDRVRHLTTALGITQARLARTLGLSPAMLSQLASARRVKIGDPAVLARLQLLDQRCATAPPRRADAVDSLLAEVAAARLHWTGDPAPPGPGRASVARPRPDGPGRPGPGVGRRANPADALRSVAPPARLAAAAVVLAPAFPELARVLREAATPPAPRPAARRVVPGRPPTGGTSVA
jgi:hypothetical protein